MDKVVRNVVGACLIALVVSWMVCFVFGPFYIVNRARATTRKAEWATETAEKIQYIYEPRTGLCFALFREGYGMVLSEVPYEKVKEQLINPPENPFEANPFDSPEETTIQTR